MKLMQPMIPTQYGGIYAFAFDQQGLMAGLGLQGSKIMRD
jgi:lipid-binding SYLF domain-containing protein